MRALEQLGLKDDVLWMFEQISTQRFFTMDPQTYLPLVLEVLSSFEFDYDEYDHGPAQGEIKFRMANQEKKLTLREVRHIFHLPGDGSTQAPIGFIENVFWSQISSETRFSPSSARASSISNPCIRYVHRVLAHTVFGRGDSDGMVRHSELFLLWCMLHGYFVDIAYFFMKHLDKVAKAKKGAIVIGGFLTPLALFLGIAPYGIEVVRGNTRLDIESCIAMRMIVRDGDTYCLVVQPGLPTLPLPNPGRTSVQNPENWKIAPTAAPYVPHVPPPPAWGSGDPHDMGEESSPPRATEPSHHRAPGSSSRRAAPAQGGWQSHLDPGFQSLQADVHRITSTLGRVFDYVVHMHDDIEEIKDYLNIPRRGDAGGSSRGDDPMDTTAPAEDDEEATDSDH